MSEVSENDSTSAMIHMNQAIKERILRNHLLLILLANILQMSAVIYTIIWAVWYNDLNEGPIVMPDGEICEDSSAKYGLLLTTICGDMALNGFKNENNKEIGGSSSFLLFACGVFVQTVYFIQLTGLFKGYSKNNARGKKSCKLLKFKTCHWVALFLYLGAIVYWVIVVFLVQVVSDASNFGQLKNGFWVSCGALGAYILASVYFNFLKKSIRKNELVVNLLQANRTFRKVSIDLNDSYLEESQ